MMDLASAATTTTTTAAAGALVDQQQQQQQQVPASSSPLMILASSGKGSSMNAGVQPDNGTVSGGGGGPAVTLTIRLIMQGKEVGSIIGKRGDNIKRLREESGAKINISDGSCPERIVTVTGPTDGILKAFSLISAKFEEDMPSLQQQQQQFSAAAGGGQQLQQPQQCQGRPLVTLRLVVPASQCGSLIGKGGAKIKEIREVTGATIQVASEMLPNSTERAVTISGSADGITKCIYQICCVMLESPPKGATIPYRPKQSPQMPPVIFAGGQAYTIQGQYAYPHPDLTKLHQLALQHSPAAGVTPVTQQQQQQQHQQAVAAAAAAAAGLAAYGLPQGLGQTGAGLPAPPPPPHPPSARSNQHQVSSSAIQQQQQQQEMSIPNELIGCIIGKGGAKINEIRQLSGATIKISNTEEGSKDRTVVIAGQAESIHLAQYLINSSLQNAAHHLAAAAAAVASSGHLQPTQHLWQTGKQHHATVVLPSSGSTQQQQQQLK